MPLITFVLILVATGLAMVFNTSSADMLDRQSGGFFYLPLLKQCLNLVIGILFGFIAYKVGSERLIRLATPLLWGITFCLLLVLIPGVGIVRNGAHRWLGIGGITFQPSEFAKLILPLYAISRLELVLFPGIPFHLGEQIFDRGEGWRSKSTCLVDEAKNQSSWPKDADASEREFRETALGLTFWGIVKRMIPIFPAIFLIALEPDNGTCAILLVTLLAVFWIVGISPKYWLLPTVALVVVGGTLAYQLPYVRERIAVYLNPELDLLGRGHQPYQAKIAAGSGGFLGRGVGQSMQKLSYLPEAQNDYIAAIFAEECGFLGMALLILLYMGVTLCGFVISFRAKTLPGAQVAILVTFLIAIQAFVNLAVVSGLAPSKGLNLPFFSQGGTCLIANITFLALLLAVAKEKEWEGKSSSLQGEQQAI